MELRKANDETFETLRAEAMRIEREVNEINKISAKVIVSTLGLEDPSKEGDATPCFVILTPKGTGGIVRPHNDGKGHRVFWRTEE